MQNSQCEVPCTIKHDKTVLSTSTGEASTLGTRKQFSGNRKQETGNRKQETGNMITGNRCNRLIGNRNK